MKAHHETAELDYRAIHALALENLDVVFDLWHRDGTPSGAIAALNPDASPGRRIKNFHLISSSPFRAADLQGSGAEWSDFTALVEYLGDVPRDVAARFLRDHVEQQVANRRPSHKSA
jgi:hypothetical protein